VGIGSALILNDKLFTGTNGIAGEIGYSIPSPSHIRSSFYEEGALEALISGRALDEKVKALKIGFYSLKELFESSDTEYNSIRNVILEEIRDTFFVILLATISVINPSLVILSGRIGINIGRLLKDEWEKALQVHVSFPPQLLVSEIGSLANVNGAVRLALSNVEDELSASE
jgi:predicted NBD/HSP70 family sugar kinase